MNVLRNFRIYLSFCLLECVMVAFSVEPHFKIKGKENLADNSFIENIWLIRLQTDSLKHVLIFWRNSLYISSIVQCSMKEYALVFIYLSCKIIMQVTITNFPAICKIKTKNLFSEWLNYYRYGVKPNLFYLL